MIRVGPVPLKWQVGQRSDDGEEVGGMWPGAKELGTSRSSEGEKGILLERPEGASRRHLDCGPTKSLCSSAPEPEGHTSVLLRATKFALGNEYTFRMPSFVATAPTL